MLEAF